MVIATKIALVTVAFFVGNVVYQKAPWSIDQPQQPASAATPIACANTFGVPSASAIAFISELQNSTVEVALKKATARGNPIHMLLRAVPAANVSAFERCAGLPDGYITSVANTKRPKSDYRKFLWGCVECAGKAFRQAGVAWPTEDSLIDVMEMTSLSWLKSWSKLYVYANKYRPSISALPAPGPMAFRQCMLHVEDMAGAPKAGSRQKGDVSGFQATVASLSGQPIARAAGQKTAVRKPETEDKWVGPSRRLMKGGSGYYYSSYGSGGDCEEDDECADSCFGADGLVVDAVTGREMRVGGVKIGDRLRTTVEDDEVWYLVSMAGKARMVRIRIGERALDVTPGHLISTEDGMRAAKHIRVGESIRTLQGLAKVTGIEHAVGHVVAPITKSGTVVVNGIVASTYAFGNHDLIHGLTFPGRLLYTLSPSVGVPAAQLFHLFFDWLKVILPLGQNMDAVVLGSLVAFLSIPIGMVAIAKPFRQRIKRTPP